MEFSNLKKDITAVLKLDKIAFSRVAGDKSATFIGLILILGPPVINLLLASFAFPSGFGVIFSRFMLWPMMVPALAVVGAVYGMSQVARRYFKGAGNDGGFFRVVSYAAAVLWLSIVPFILALFGVLEPIGIFNLIWLVGMVWIFVVAYNMLQYHHRLNDKDAVTVAAIGVIGYLALKWLLGAILVGSSFRFWF